MQNHTQSEPGQHFGPNRPARVGREPDVSQNPPIRLGGLGTQLWDTHGTESVQLGRTWPNVSQ